MIAQSRWAVQKKYLAVNIRACQLPILYRVDHISWPFEPRRIVLIAARDSDRDGKRVLVSRAIAPVPQPLVIGASAVKSQLPIRNERALALVWDRITFVERFGIR